MDDLKKLASDLPSGSLVDDPDVLESYSRDRSEFTPAGRPLAAVVARSVEDVQATLAFASSHRIPVVVRGAGSGLSGGANAVEDSLVLVTMQMDAIVVPGQDSCSRTDCLEPIVNSSCKISKYVWSFS